MTITLKPGETLTHKVVDRLPVNVTKADIRSGCEFNVDPRGFAIQRIWNRRHPKQYQAKSVNVGRTDAVVYLANGESVKLYLHPMLQFDSRITRPVRDMVDVLLPR